VLGMFANLIASCDSSPLISNDFVDAVFMAMMAGDDAVSHRALVILGELRDQDKLWSQSSHLTQSALA